MKILFFSLVEVADRQRHAGIRHVDDDVDLVHVVPLASDVGRRHPACSDDRRKSTSMFQPFFVRPESSTAICAASVEPGPPTSAYKTRLIAERADLDVLVHGLRRGASGHAKHQSGAEQQRRNTFVHELLHRLINLVPGPFLAAQERERLSKPSHSAPAASR